MKLRLFAATAAATALAATAFAAPASAQGLDVIDGVIANFNCGVLDTGLKAGGAYESDHAQNKTTRNELAANLRELGDSSLGGIFDGIPGGGLLQVQYAGQIADRALVCDLVAENPELPFGSSQLFDNLPMLEALSSQFN